MSTCMQRIAILALLLVQLCSGITNYTHGVALGGLFVMETTWMFDQFSAPSENDWIHHLRANSDMHAITTMRNHWESYVAPSMIRELAERGIDRIRVPVGYWIAEAPVRYPPCLHPSPGSKLCQSVVTNWEGCLCKWRESDIDVCDWDCLDGSSLAPRAVTMYDFGLNAEGFVTGGINYLERLLATMKRSSILAMIDLHAVASGSTDWDAYAGVWVDSADPFWGPCDSSAADACPANAQCTTDAGDAGCWSPPAAANFSGPSQPVFVESGAVGDCGMQTGEWALPETWDGDQGCASIPLDTGFGSCSCGAGPYGAGDPIAAGWASNLSQSGMVYWSTRAGGGCLLDPSTGAAYVAPHVSPSAMAASEVGPTGCSTWMDVAVTTLVTISQWIIDLEQGLGEHSKFCAAVDGTSPCAGVVNAIETINEPALYTEATHGPGIRWFANRTIPTIRHLLDEGGREDVEIVLSYTGSDAESFAQFVGANTADWGTQSVSVDFHQYFTWDHGVYSPGSDTVTWAQAATEVSHGQWNQFSQYYSSINHIKSYVGEWTLAINGDQVHLAQADENNLFDGHMKATYQEQASSPSRRKQAILAQKRTITHSLSDNRPAVRAAFMAQKCNWFETGATGDYYWSARMGSGWDPRSCGQFETNLTVLATPGFGLNKCQVTNSSYDNSLARFRFPLWNFLESAKQLGIDRELMRNFASLCNHKEV